ncbi:MAG: B12-binding domain-containing radical SAM protein [Candidatus Nezhaarchaeota archaeon]|nr:B12-binding domain-containing radical SAM protein [Candidatus Nezhaarchaeota archaeon]MCX8142526.1 B12-binding domain-containing radical SAM protein [Candidatus Nezhaarchaeota archaeon]MDW8050501.1 radical SAM protein [Nitrososphaerota archaeon]
MEEKCRNLLKPRTFMVRRLTAKILLAVPPGCDKLEVYQVAGIKAPPLGLAWIASVLESHGHEVKIIDSPTLGLSITDFVNAVKSWSPSIVGLSSLTPTIKLAYKAARAVKTVDRDIKVIVGGPHATFMWHEVLNSCRDIDYVVLGEGERSMLMLVEAIERGCIPRHVQGIALRNEQGEPVCTGPWRSVDLDSIPPPARHLLPMDKYTLFDKPIRVIHLMASRGCPYGCIFCVTSYFFGRRVRYRRVDSVLDEIAECKDKYKTRTFVFTDDELTINKRWMNDFLRGLRERGLDIRWTCGSRVDTVDDELLRKMYSHGCKTIYFGVESGSQRTLERIGKRISLNQVQRVFETIRRIGGTMVATFMLGFPWETISDMKQTLKFALKLDPDYAQFTYATPYPGTPLYEMAKSHNLIVDHDWSHYTTLRPVMRGFHFTLKDLESIFREAYRRFYLRLRFMVKQVKMKAFKSLLRIVFNNVVISRLRSLT